MIWTRRGSRRAFVVWCGVLVYTIYYYAFYVFGFTYTVLYPLYLALMGLGVYSLIGLLAGVDLGAFAAGVDAKMPVRTLAVILLIALLFVPLWGSMLAQDIAAQQPRVTALVFVLDLCFLLPAIAIAAVQLWQRRPFGYLLSGILLIKAAVSGILLAISTVWAAQLGMPLARGRAGDVPVPHHRRLGRRVLLHAPPARNTAPRPAAAGQPAYRSRPMSTPSHQPSRSTGARSLRPAAEPAAVHQPFASPEA